MKKNTFFLYSLIILLFSKAALCQNYNMPTIGVNNTSIGSCPVTLSAGNFYDNGGLGGNYTANINGIVRTFSSSVPGQCLSVTFTSFSMNDTYFLCFGPGNCCDYLQIYDGPNTDGVLLYNNCTVSPGTITSTTGSLTFRFVTDGSVQLAGWAATFSTSACAGAQTASTNSDCVNATTIFGDTNFNDVSSGLGVVAEGCSGCNTGEQYSNWYKFTAATSGTLGFTINPDNDLDNFDFALYGANTSCGSLGSPVRCSAAQVAGNGNTGLQSGSVDQSEDVNGDQFVAPLTVTAGETYLLLINAFSSSSGSSGYSISFNGTASIDPQSVGKALHFDGTDDYVSISNLTATTNSNYTIEGWFKTSLTNTVQDIVSGHTNDSLSVLVVEVQLNGTLRFLHRVPAGQTGGNSVYTSSIVNNGAWHHFAAVHGPDELKIYLDGVLQGQSFFPEPISPAILNILLGKLHTDDRRFQGSMDEIRFWNRALCSAEIVNNMNCEIPTTGNGLVANFHFNQGTASSDNTSPAINTLIDATGNGFTGTLNHFALLGSTSNWIAPGGVISGTNCAAFAVPEINVKGGVPLITIFDGSYATSTTDSTDFGNVNGGSNKIHSFTINNTGSSTLNITSITSDNSTYTISGAPTSITAGNSATFNVTFSPTANGVQNATITINNNDCDEAVYDFAVQGNGMPSALYTANKTVSYINKSIQFTDQSIGAISWSWNFGDGGVSNLQYPTYIYTSPGEYSVTLSINAGASTLTKTNYIRILPNRGTPYVVATSGSTFEINQLDFGAQAISGSINRWELGVPSNFLVTVNSPVNAWKTDLDANLGPPTSDYVCVLQTPSYNLSSSASAYTLRFRRSMEIVACNGPFAVQLQYSTDQGDTWTRLGVNADPAGTNWYNRGPATGCPVDAAIFADRYGWTLTSNNTLSTYNITTGVPSLVGQPSVCFRFVLSVASGYASASYNADGFMVDDFEILGPTNAPFGSDQPPVAADDNGAGLIENGPNGIVNVLTNDTDPNGNPSAPVNGVGQFTIDLDPGAIGNQTSFTDAQGIWTLNTATADVTFDPANNYIGTASIPYTLCDPGSLCDTANIIFVVTPSCNYEINVQGGSPLITINDGDAVPSIADSTNFGNVGVGNNKIHSFTIQNIGTATLNISSITSSNGLFVVSGAPNSITAGNSATFDVTFSPTAIGIQNATITIHNNDCDEGVYDFAVQGSGCVTPTITCPGNQSAYTTSTTCNATVTYSSSSTGVPTPAITYTFTGATPGSGNGTGSGSLFNKGTTTVTITASNSCGSATCSFDVVVTDTTKPSITCPADSTVYLVNNCSVALGDYTTASHVTLTATVNSGSSATTCTDGFMGGSPEPHWQVIVAGQTAVTYPQNGICFNNPPNLQYSQQYACAQLYPDSIEVCFRVFEDDGAACIVSASCLEQLCQKFATPAPGNNATYTMSIPAGGGNTSSGWVSFTLNTSGVFGVCPVTATDNCGAVIITQSPTVGTPLGVGNHTITLYATDSSNNQSSCTHTITVLDTIKPTIACPGNISQANDPGFCSAIVTYTVSSSDNCSGQTVAQTEGLASGSTFPVGTTINKFIVTDASGNNDSCSFTVTVNDTTKPNIINCAGNQILYITGSNCTADYSIPFPTLSDNCTGPITWNASFSGNALGNPSNLMGLANGVNSLPITFQQGITTVILTATDSSGNTSMSNCSFTVTVQNAPLTSIVCPNDTTVNNDAGQCGKMNWNGAGCNGYIVADIPFAPIAGSGTVVTLSDDQVSSALPIGFDFNFYCQTYNQFYISSNGFITFSAGQPNGCCSGQNLPNATSPNNLIAGVWTDLNPGAGGTISYFTTGTAPNRQLVVQYDSVRFFGSALTTTFQIVLNENGNNADVFISSVPSITSRIKTEGIENLNSTQALTVSGRNANNTWTATNDGKRFYPQFSLSSVNNSCSGLIITNNSPNFYPVGTTPVIWTVIDVSGNIVSCTQQVTVNDTEAPKANALLFTSFEAGLPTGWTATGLWHVSSSCIGLPTPDGSNWAYYGHDSSCNFNTGTGTANSGALSAPVIHIPASVTAANITFWKRYNGEGSPISSSYDKASFRINGIDQPVTINGTLYPLNGLQNGIDNLWQRVTVNANAFIGQNITMSWFFNSVDGIGNDHLGLQIDSVYLQLDGINECPQNITINALAGQCGANASWTAPVYFDNCALQSVISSHNPGDFFPIGNTTVTYTATDIHANTETCTFTVTVNDIGPDIEATGNGNSIADGDVTASLNDHTDFGQTTLAPITRTFTIQNMGLANLDLSANALSVTGVDASFFALSNITLPATLSAPNGSITFDVTYTPSTLGLHHATIEIQSNDCDEATFNFDIKGERTCLPPSFNTCPPSNINIDNDLSLCSAVVNYTSIAGGIPAPVYTYLMNGASSGNGSGNGSGMAFNVGVTTVTVYATNACGVDSCSFSVTVNDTTKPTIACPASITVNNIAGLCSTVVNYSTPAGSDNCTGATTVQTEGLPSGASFPNGVTLNKFVVTDSSGNKDSCSFTVTVLGVSLQAKALLDGAYNPGLGLMHDSLRIKNLIPSTEPYSMAPFNRTPISEPGGETVSPSVLSVVGNNAIVDWVMLELRSASNPATVLANKRALIQRDGDMVSATDGVSPVFFANTLPGNYFVSVKHRNHLGVMSLHPLALAGCPVALYDFTIGSVYTNPMISNPPRRQVGGVYTLWAADHNYTKNVKYNGISNDKDVVLNALGGPAFLNAILSNVYRAEDGNMDGKIRFNNTDNDRALILNTVGVNTPNMVVGQHTPN